MLSSFSKASGFAFKEDLRTKIELKITYVVACVVVVASVPLILTESASSQQPNHLYLDPVCYLLDECAAPMGISTYSNVMTTTECDTDQLKLTYLNPRETKHEYLNSILWNVVNKNT